MKMLFKLRHIYIYIMSACNKRDVEKDLCMLGHNIHALFVQSGCIEFALCKNSWCVFKTNVLSIELCYAVEIVKPLEVNL